MLLGRAETPRGISNHPFHVVPTAIQRAVPKRARVEDPHKNGWDKFERQVGHDGQCNPKAMVAQGLHELLSRFLISRNDMDPL